MNHAFVIPAYGRAPHLESCIQSILNQSLGPPNIAIGTSTPSDSLREVTDRYGLTIHSNPNRVDIATDWNFALNLSGADFVTVAHQDDLYDPRYLATMNALIQRHPGFLIAFSNYQEHTDAGVRRTNLTLRVKRWLCARAFGTREAIDSRASKLKLLNLGNPICCPSVVIHRKLIPDFEFRNSLKTNLDWDAWTRLSARDGAFLHSREILVSKRVHAESETSATIANRVREREDRQMFEYFWPKPVAALVSAVYKAGYWSNRT
jgi:glycosyltransferase involved in cell wall biosynthesis